MRSKFHFSVCVFAAVWVSVWCLGFCLTRFCGAFQHGLWCASMVVSVAFRVCYGSSVGREISREEGVNSLMPSSTVLVWLRLCGHRHRCVPGDDIILNVGLLLFQMLLTSA